MNSRRAMLWLLLILLCLALSGCQARTTPIPEDARLLIAGYGWTVQQPLATLQTVIPSELRQGRVSTPSSVYWNMVNACSKAIELDMQAYAGDEIQLEIFGLAENLQDRLASQYELPPGFEDAGRALVVRSSAGIIGAWLDQGGRYNYSLTGKEIEGVTGLSATDWLDDLRSVSNASFLEPEEVIHTYFARDNDAAFEQLDSQFMLEHVFSNWDESKLFSADFQPFPSGAKVELMSIVEHDHPETNVLTSKQRLFSVSFNLELPEDAVSAYGKGLNQRYFSLIRSERIGWKINAIGTGF